jgi:hypothetical protein
MDGADQYRSYLLHRETALGSTGTDGQWVFVLGDYNGDGKPDLYGINKVGTGANDRTEVHIMDGADQYRSYLLHRETALGSTGTDCQWDFATGAAICPKPPNGYIDGPPPNSTKSGIVRIVGWAKVQDSTIQSIEIWIDGVLRGTATYGTSRPDAGGNYGFYWDWNTEGYSNGWHIFRVKAVAVNGESVYLSSTNGTSPQINIQNRHLYMPLIIR